MDVLDDKLDKLVCGQSFRLFLLYMDLPLIFAESLSPDCGIPTLNFIALAAIVSECLKKGHIRFLLVEF